MKQSIRWSPIPDIGTFWYSVELGGILLQRNILVFLTDVSDLYYKIGTYFHYKNGSFYNYKLGCLRFTNVSFITKWVIYYKMGHLLQNGSFIIKWVIYYKMGHLLQNGSFIIKWVIYYKMGHLLQNGSFIIKWVIYYKMGHLLQNGFSQQPFQVNISNFLTCFCSFKLSCPILENSWKFVYCIVLSY